MRALLVWWLSILQRLFMSTDPLPPVPVVPPLAVPPMITLPSFVFADDYKGVQFVPPPPSILPTIMRQVDAATADLEPGELGFALVSDWKGGWNVAVGHKTQFGISVDAWMGSSWGTDERLNAGVRVSGKWQIGKK